MMVDSIFGTLLGIILLVAAIALYPVYRARRWSPVLFVGFLAGVILLIGALWNTGVFTPTRLNPPSAQTALTQPPTALNTAQDFLAQGDYEFDHGNFDAATAAYSRAIELNPNYAEAYNNRAYTSMTQKNYAPALADLNRAIAIRPGYVNALMNRGDIHNYYYGVSFDDAIADYDRVIALGGVENTSVCGHRLIALHHGWDPTIYLDILLHGINSGCGEPNPG